MANNTRKSDAEVLYLGTPEPIAGSHCVGSIVRLDAKQLWVDFPNNPHGPLVAQSTVAFSATEILQAIEARQSVLLTFLEQRLDLPVIIGLLQSPPVLADPKTMTTTSEDSNAPSSTLSASVDGRRVTLEAQDEVVIRCGEACITLRRNGRLSIRGVYIESRAKGTHRIKGGNVQIN